MSTRFSILIAAASLAFAQAASAITISFSTPSIDLTGGAVTDNVTISGLTAAGQAVTGYSLTIDFNAAQLAASNVNINPLPDDIGGFPTSIDNTNGNLTFSDYGNGPNGDFSVEGDSFTLASITFTPLPNLSGTSSPTFDLADSQVLGYEDPVCTSPNPPQSCPYPVVLTLSTGGGNSVPEPSTLALFALGLGALGLVAATRRRRGAAGPGRGSV